MENETLTLSQEDKLIANDNSSINAALTNPPNEESSTNQPKAKLADIKAIIESNGAAGSNEFPSSLHSGVVTIEKSQTPASRSRSKSDKLNAKRKQKSNVNPHERIKMDESDFSPKRPRDTGGTPPSATQPSKKSHATLDSGAEVSNQKRNKNQKKKEKKRLKKSMSDNKSAESNATVGNSATADKSVPPPPQGQESSGSNESAAASSQQNAESSTSDTVNQHTQNPQNDDTSETPLSYAQVTDNLCVAVIDQRGKGHMQLLDQNKFDKLNACLTDVLMSMIGGNAVLPAFDDTRLHGGAMRIRCANANTRKWLESHIPKLDAKKLWPGAKMVVINFKDLPKPHKFNVFFRNILKPAKDIFLLLEKQNKGITTKSWSVLNSGQRDGGTYMTIGVGHDSFETLRTRSNSLYCGLGKAAFNVVKSCKENKAYAQKASSTNADAATNTVGSSLLAPRQHEPGASANINAAESNVTPTVDRMEE